MTDAGAGAAVSVLERRVARLEAELEICRRLGGFCDGGPDRGRVYRFIESEQENFTVAALCRATGVSRSAFYEWRKRAEGPSEALVDEAYLANRVYDIWKRSRGRYGAPRVTAALRKAEVVANEKRVARLMGELGIAGRCGRKKIRTTWRDKRQQAAVDLLLRHFVGSTVDDTWVGDITYSAQLRVMCSTAA